VIILRAIKLSFFAVPVLSIALIISFSLPAWGTPGADPKHAEAQPDIKGISTVALLPFRSIATDADAMRGSARDPVSGAIFRTCPAVPDAERILEDIFSRKVTAFKDFKWIAVKRTGLFPEFKLWKLEALQKKGSELKADAVLTGHVFCFRERVGYPLSVEKPASVAFGIYLVRTNDGSILWRGIFDRTQQTLFENLFQASSFFKGGGKWVTAEELAEIGIDELLKTFPVKTPEKAAE
jgi:TolB-like protein